MKRFNLGFWGSEVRANSDQPITLLINSIATSGAQLYEAMD
ncbi:MAG: hypothetical protein R2773_05810 [Flavobacteriaceae bacterium]